MWDAPGSAPVCAARSEIYSPGPPPNYRLPLVDRLPNRSAAFRVLLGGRNRATRRSQKSCRHLFLLIEQSPASPQDGDFYSYLVSSSFFAVFVTVLS